jgi:hypothetical protein
MDQHQTKAQEDGAFTLLGSLKNEYEDFGYWIVKVIKNKFYNLHRLHGW